MPVLLVLEPLTHIFLPICKEVGTLSLTFAFHILTFVTISVFEYGFPFAVWLASLHLAGIDRTVLKRIGTYLDFG